MALIAATTCSRNRMFVVVVLVAIVVDVAVDVVVAVVAVAAFFSILVCVFA